LHKCGRGNFAGWPVNDVAHLLPFIRPAVRSQGGAAVEKKQGSDDKTKDEKSQDDKRKPGRVDNG
jgi:hypothetical protein